VDTEGEEEGGEAEGDEEGKKNLLFDW